MFLIMGYVDSTMAQFINYYLHKNIFISYIFFVDQTVTGGVKYQNISHFYTKWLSIRLYGPCRSTVKLINAMH